MKFCFSGLQVPVFRDCELLSFFPVMMIELIKKHPRSRPSGQGAAFR